MRRPDAGRQRWVGVQGCKSWCQPLSPATFGHGAGDTQELSRRIFLEVDNVTRLLSEPLADGDIVSDG